MKTIEEIDFSELTDECTRIAHDGLIRDGAKGLRNAIWSAMQTAILWKQKQDEKRKEKKK